MLTKKNTNRTSDEILNESLTYRMDNVVVEQPMLLVDIVIVDEMMVVVNVVLFKPNHSSLKHNLKKDVHAYVVDIEMDSEQDQACYNVVIVLA